MSNDDTEEYSQSSFIAFSSFQPSGSTLPEVFLWQKQRQQQQKQQQQQQQQQ